MTEFNWLVVGHFVADWILQNDWMAVGKHDSLFSIAGVVHYIIYTAVILSVWVFCTPVPVGIASFTMVGLIILLSHWLVDGVNLATRWMQIYGQDDQPMVRVVIDQTFHILVLAGVVSVFSGRV